MKKTLFFLLLASPFFHSATAFAAPAQVILIRHAEKPGNSNQLSEQGFKRAEALVKFFRSEPAVTRYGPPVAIYAAAPKDEDGSVRSVQTVTPLARALDLEIDTRFTRGQVGKLVKDIMEDPAYEGRMVLVCWQHGRIPDVLMELAEYNGSSQAVVNALPLLWPDWAFDRAWLLTFSRGKAVSFLDIPQRLLPGDTAK